MERYRTAVTEFNRLIARLKTYQGRAQSPDVAWGILQLINEATYAALTVRKNAEDLGAYSNSFARLDSGIAYFGDIATIASEVYETRLRILREIERGFGSLQRNTAPSPSILAAHEGFKGGHLREKHVAQSMNDFKQRFLKEGKKTLSSFIDDPTAEEAVARALELEQPRIDRAPNGMRLKIPLNELKVIGYVKERDIPPRLTKSGTVIINKDSSHPSGYRIVTATLGDKNK